MCSSIYRFPGIMKTVFVSNNSFFLTIVTSNEFFWFYLYIICVTSDWSHPNSRPVWLWEISSYSWNLQKKTCIESSICFLSFFPSFFCSKYVFFPSLSRKSYHHHHIMWFIGQWIYCVQSFFFFSPPHHHLYLRSSFFLSSKANSKIICVCEDI